MSDNYIPQVDYTSRDYASIREELISLIPYFAPQWTNRDPSDFGMTLIELFSYLGDQLNYYIDRSINESFITTASQRESVIRLARLLGYIPTDSKASTVILTFSNSTSEAIVVPERTQVATSASTGGQVVQVIFETDNAVTVPAKANNVNGSITVTATQGETKGYGVDVDNGELGVSDGSPNQVFEIPDSPVIEGSIEVYVSGVRYTQVPYLIDYQGYDPVFSTSTDSDGITSIIFGDNISGRIPNNGAPVYAAYRIGGGAIGNVAVGSIRSILTNQAIGLTVSNQNVGLVSGAASGGADPEPTDVIRVNAPKSIRALSRAVSLSDYSSLAIQVSGVAKAVSVADVYSSVTIYIAPYGDSGLQADGVTSSTVFNNLTTTIFDYFTDKIPPGTSLTLQPPKYVDVKLKVTCVIQPQYRTAQVTTVIQSALKELFAFDNVAFGDYITPADVYAVLGEVEGVARSSIIKMIRKDEDKNWVISNKALTNNVATLTTTLTHNLKVGETVLVSGVTDNTVTFNGTFVVTAVTSNTFSYALVGPTVGSAPVSPNGAVTLIAVKDIVCLTNELPQLELTKVSGVTTITGLDLTTSGGIS